MNFLYGANALLVVYDPLSEMESALQSLAQLIGTHSKYFPLPVATIASKLQDQAANKHLNRILQPCFHVTLNFDKPCIDKHSKVSIYSCFNVIYNFVKLNV